jgi:bud site selection protein 31
MQTDRRIINNLPTIELFLAESQWPVHQINWQRSRYIYDLYYVYNKISKEIYDYCVSNKIVDPALIAKWKKPGYERLCSTYAINPRNYKFGTVSICRVPKSSLTAVRKTQTVLLHLFLIT